MQLDFSNSPKYKEENVQSTPHGKLIHGGNAFGVIKLIGIYSSAFS